MSKLTPERVRELRALELTHERLREHLDYDPETGIMRWRKSKRGRLGVGAEAGTLGNAGYILICINQRDYLRSRLAWFYVHGRWPLHCIDHINGRKDDDRLCNLREATHFQNMANYPRRTRGVRLRENGRYQAYIKTAGKQVALGIYPTAELAIAARLKAEQDLWGEYAHNSLAWAAS